MAWDVHLSVCFPCDSAGGLAELATKRLADLPSDAPREVRQFLEAVEAGNGYNDGHKGALFSWGIVGNYTNARLFVETLRAFWEDLLAGGEDDEACDHEHVLVFYEDEQSEAASAYEIFWDNPQSEIRQLVFRHHERLPFAWMQF